MRESNMSRSPKLLKGWAEMARKDTRENAQPQVCLREVKSRSQDPLWDELIDLQESGGLEAVNESLDPPEATDSNVTYICFTDDKQHIHRIPFRFVLGLY